MDPTAKNRSRQDVRPPPPCLRLWWLRDDDEVNGVVSSIAVRELWFLVRDDFLNSFRLPDDEADPPLKPRLVCSSPPLVMMEGCPFLALPPPLYMIL